MMSAFTIESLERLSPARFSRAKEVQLLTKGKESFESIFKALRDAKRSICLQFYIFKNDETGQELARVLSQKSLEGVKVYLLYDHFGSLGTPRSFWRNLTRAGVKIKASHPFRWTAPLRYVHRDHRKLMVIDVERAFTGGLNIADEYRGFHLRLRGRGWRDTGIFVEGPVVRELFNTFKESWYAWGGEKIEIAAHSESEGAAASQGSIPSERDIGVLVLPIFAYTRKSKIRMRSLLNHSLERAEQSISLTTAYFIPSRKLIRRLEDAVKRGVHVRLLVPGKSDIPAASFAGRALFAGLLKAGVEIYLYQGDMLHAKTYAFDRCWSIIGSTNLDYQSLIYNDEGNIGILNVGFGSKIDGVFEEDLKYALKIDREHWAKRPFLDKLKEHFFALFRKRL
jgi:cardiolipin synthase A/B